MFVTEVTDTVPTFPVRPATSPPVSVQPNTPVPAFIRAAVAAGISAPHTPLPHYLNHLAQQQPTTPIPTFMRDHTPTGPMPVFMLEAGISSPHTSPPHYLGQEQPTTPIPVLMREHMPTTPIPACTLDAWSFPSHPPLPSPPIAPNHTHPVPFGHSDNNTTQRLQRRVISDDSFSLNTHLTTGANDLVIEHGSSVDSIGAWFHAAQQEYSQEVAVQIAVQQFGFLGDHLAGGENSALHVGGHGARSLRCIIFWITAFCATEARVDKQK